VDAIEGTPHRHCQQNTWKRGRTVRLFGDEQPLEGSSVTYLHYAGGHPPMPVVTKQALLLLRYSVSAMQGTPSPTSGDVTSAAAATVTGKSTLHPLHRGDMAALPTVT
jgi:hypothetical protein